MPATTTPVKQKAAAQKSVADKSAALKKEHAAKLKAIAKEKAAAPPMCRCNPWNARPPRLNAR